MPKSGSDGSAVAGLETVHVQACSLDSEMASENWFRRKRGGWARDSLRAGLFTGRELDGPSELDCRLGLKVLLASLAVVAILGLLQKVKFKESREMDTGTCGRPK
ncbi:hypothetical protein BC832DRAFT_539876 [Gaertneriomyces semiglobifer]|nr:hypothetical protein BC832DRAFT_539876 [Gaertneriomyces semiglobifer]